MASPPPSAPEPPGVACPHCGETHPSTYTHCPKTGKALTSGRALVGRVIAGRYKVIGLLGEGGMGAVYIAEHTLIGRKVAIKRLHPELAADEKAVQRFQREARAAASTGHEHIVEILDLGYAEDGAPYLVMEYLRGQSLAALLRKETRITAHRACEIVGQALAALDAVHRQQILHRDLKPDNVFLTRRQGYTDYVKILDFGISKMKRDEGDGLDLTRTGVMLGTPFYMSPEQARGMKNLDLRVDLYAMGVILYECLTGRVPYEADNYHQLLQAILREEPPPIRALAPDVDPALEQIVLKAITKDPAQRYPHASAMLAALIPHGARVPSSAETLESGEGAAVSMGGAATPPEPSSGSPAIPTPTAPLPPIATAPLPPAPLAPTPTDRGVGPEKIDERAATAYGAGPPPRPSADRGTPRRPVTPAAPPVSVATPTGTPRYFFAASDDWDDARARAATQTRSTPSMRDATREPGSYPRDAEPRPTIVREPASADRAGGREPSGRFSIGGGREPSGPFAIGGGREPSGAFATGGGREPSGAFATGGSEWASRGGAGDAEVKGSLVIAALDHLDAVHGTPTADAVRAQLDPASQDRLRGVVLPMAWLPLSLYEQILRAAERTVGGGEGSASAAIGRATADRELPTTHRLFMQTASPSAAAERIPQLFRLYHGRGEARVSPTPGGGVRVEIDAGMPESLNYAWAMAGFLNRMLELTGGREVRAGVVSCRARGDAQTAIALRWR